jgi:hypothetical protein
VILGRYGEVPDDLAPYISDWAFRERPEWWIADHSRRATKGRLPRPLQAFHIGSINVRLPNSELVELDRNA